MKALHCIPRARLALLGSTLVGAPLLALKEGKAAEDYSGWSLNFTPVLIAPKADYGWGGGADPELKYTIDRGGARLSAGLRIGVYYAKDSFGSRVRCKKSTAPSFDSHRWVRP